MERTMVEQTVHWNIDAFWSLWRTPHQKRKMWPEQSWSLWTAHAETCFLTGGDKYSEVICSLKTVPYGTDPCWNSLWKTVTLGKNPTLKQWESVNRNEWQRQHIMNWLQLPYSNDLHHSGVVEVEGSQVKYNLGRRKIGAKLFSSCLVGWLICFVYFSHPIPYFIGRN